MDPFTQTDLETIVRLVAEAGDPTITLPVPARKAMLVESVARLIDADVWAWYADVIDPAARENVMATSFIDGGFSSPQDRAQFLQMLTVPEHASELNAAAYGWVERGNFVTLRRQDLISGDAWQRVGPIFRAAGYADALLALYPISPTTFTGAGFHRRQGKPDFADRERAIVHLVFGQVDWLHRHGTNLPIGPKTLQLTARERDVLAFLLNGDSRKQIAAALGISEHTVSDYLKQLYRHFNVSSRGELQAHFIAGGVS